MNNFVKWFGITALTTVIGFSMAACSMSGGGVATPDPSVDHQVTITGIPGSGYVTVGLSDQPYGNDDARINTYREYQANITGGTATVNFQPYSLYTRGGYIIFKQAGHDTLYSKTPFSYERETITVDYADLVSFTAWAVLHPDHPDAEINSNYSGDDDN